MSESSILARDPATDPVRVRLDNGVSVLVREHAAADVAAVQLWLRVGARDEGAEDAGLSHFIEHLLFKGTPARGPGVIDQVVSGLGGEMNAATSQDFTYYHVVLPARHLETALDVVADAAMHAAFDPAQIERERLVVLEEIRRAEDSPTASLWRVLSRHHFDGHPYGRPVLGTPESIRAAGRDRIVGYFDRHYVPANAVVVVVGNVDPDRTVERVDAIFGGWGGGRGRPIPPRRPAIPPEPSGIRRAEERRSLQQTYLAVAWPGPVVPDPGVYAVDLLTSILGQGRASRLHQSLRERRGLVSSIGAGYSLQREAGTISVTARTTATQRMAVGEALLEEIERVRQALVDEGELQRALTAVEAGHAFGQETAEGVAYAYGLAETVWTLSFELEYVERIRLVTRERIRDAACRFLLPARFTEAILAPASGAA